MIKVGLTGPTGAGKGEVGKLFARNGITCIDTDKISRKVCEKGKPCLIELARNFGDAIINDDGTLNRKKLADIVFLAEDKKDRTALLNKITHKYIIAEIMTQLNTCEERVEPCAVIDAPLLFEAGLEDDCDYIIAVLADTETRIQRIIKRDNITRELACERVSTQKSDKFFIDNCDRIIYNNGDEHALEAIVLPIIEKLKLGELPDEEK